MKRAIFTIILLLLFYPALHSANAMTEEEAISWAYSEVGNWSAFPDGSFEGQCTALVFRYAWENFGARIYLSPREFDSFDVSTLPEGWEKIDYTPGFIPDPGDIVYWHPGNTRELIIYGTGHTAIVVSASGSSWITLDQNYGAANPDEGSSAGLAVRNTYALVSGVLRPPFNGENGYQIPRPIASIAGEAYISRGESAQIELSFSGIGPWTLEYLEGDIERTRVFYDRENTLTVSPSKSTIYSLICVTDSSFYNFTETLLEEIIITVSDRNTESDSGNTAAYGVVLPTRDEPLKGSDDWARAELEPAFDLGVAPESIVYIGWKGATTRIEVAKTIVSMIEMHSKLSVFEMAQLRGWDLMQNTFSDTRNPNVTFLRYAGITDGIGDNKYNPVSTITRAEFVTMIGRVAEIFFNETMMGTHPFNDVPLWASPYIGYAVDKGITYGVSETRFNSNGLLQNQHTAIFALRAYVAMGDSFTG